MKFTARKQDGWRDLTQQAVTTDMKDYVGHTKRSADMKKCVYLSGAGRKSDCHRLSGSHMIEPSALQSTLAWCRRAGPPTSAAIAAWAQGHNQGGSGFSGVRRLLVVLCSRVWPATTRGSLTLSGTLT